MYEIPTAYGPILLDDEDVPLIEGKKVTAHYYPAIHRPQLTVRVNGKGLARLLLGAPVGMQVDHINHNNLDNRRSNLRLATRAQNLQNRRPWGKKNGHGYKGLIWKAAHKRWEGRITINGKRRVAGGSSNVHKAALKWNRYAIAAYGEFAYPNDVPCFSDSPEPRDDRCSTCHAVCHCCCVCETP